jgi:hypothetical protein
MMEIPMKVNPLKLTSAILLVFALVATAPPALAQATNDQYGANKIQSKFDVIKLKKETFGTEVNKCIPTISADSSFLEDSIKDFPSNGIRTYRNPAVASIFVVHQTTGLCLKLSPEKHPIFAAEAFVKTVDPKGVPQNVVDGWHKQIAATIAQKGSARIAYVFSNGNAFIVNYSVKSDSPYELMYSLELPGRQAHGKAKSWTANSRTPPFPRSPKPNETGKASSPTRFYTERGPATLSPLRGNQRTEDRGQ